MFGDYGSVALKFGVSDLPSDYNTTEWMAKLRDGIVKALQPYSVSSGQVEIESTMVLFEDSGSVNPESSPQQRSHNILKRRELRQVFVVNVNILPSSASTTNIAMAQEVRPIKLYSTGLNHCSFCRRWANSWWVMEPWWSLWMAISTGSKLNKGFILSSNLH